MRILILVICTEDFKEHSMLAQSIKNTWGKTSGADIWYLWARNRKVKEPNDYILNIEDGYGAMLRSIVNFLFKKRNDHYDYVLKVNTGSYVDIPRLQTFLLNKPRDNYYAGIAGEIFDNQHGKIRFVSGSGIILSWDLAMRLLQEASKINFDHIDDVAIGQFMQERGVPISDGMRVTMHTGGMIFQMGEPIIPEEAFEYDKVYHFRLRSEDGQRWRDRDQMIQLYHKFNS